jgi:16S rRNA (guanine527-N7)-methyltransferase
VAQTPPTGAGSADLDAGIEPVPATAATVFGSSLPTAIRYAELLATTGVAHGLIGPREPARIWSRHLLNSAVVAELIPPASRVVDVGSGAGLPGLALALARPDVRVTLVEPLQRRAEFLGQAVVTLDLADRVSVLRGRAEDAETVRTAGNAEVVVARAVARLDRVVRWCLPLLAPGGWLLALKGESAEAELAEHDVAVRRAGGTAAEVTTCGRGLVSPPTVVIRMRRVPRPPRQQRPQRQRKGGTG